MALNDMGYDAVTLGNHEFDLGPDELLRALRGEAIEVAGQAFLTEPIAMPVVCSNLELVDKPELAAMIQPKTILEKAGQLIGIVGSITQMMATSSNPWPSVSAADYVTGVQAQVDALQAQGVNKVVLLSHNGFDVDKNTAALLSGVDVICSPTW